MLNYVWAGLIIAGVIYAALTGNISKAADAMLDSSREAVELCISLAGIMCLWTGLMKIVERGGLISAASKALRPLLRFLFPGVPPGHPAAGAVFMNMAANFFGLGNAATPLGIKAMKELQKINREKSVITVDMIMFIVLNTVSLQLLPTNLIAIRSALGSAAPAVIVVPVWIVSLISAATGVAAVKIFALLVGKKLKGK